MLAYLVQPGNGEYGVVFDFLKEPAKHVFWGVFFSKQRRQQVSLAVIYGGISAVVRRLT